MKQEAEFSGLQNDILELKKKRNAVILAHLYQRPEVQDIADFTGDSLGLSEEAAKTDAEVIVFCGVHFMAETAAILSPQKTVLLPEVNAGCPMADMITADQLRAKKKECPDAVVVCYVNSSADVKAESDICCTSANAVKVVRSAPANKRILFVPDKNLGHYVGQQAGREVIYWEGFCNTHDRLSAEQLRKAKQTYPEALVMVHPECRPEVIALADRVFSTSGMIKFAKESDHKEFILGTEAGILHKIRKTAPGKKFHMASDELICPNMKATTLEKVKLSLEELQPRIMVPDEIRDKALGAVKRMIAVK
ncbi:quinolinate synthase NadA [Phosphitispora fastidiosa]|uniref:quinolinate synthase NadA n=1 Tax=Phosphitispora fastidiosa TaxID=2837202 RepID=UPI001E40FB65